MHITDLITDAEQIHALLSIPAHLGEDINQIVRFEEVEDYMSPYIYIQDNDCLEMTTTKTKFVIIADGTEVCTTDKLLRAIKLLLGCYYIFNMAYPTKMQNTLCFMQKVFLKLMPALSETRQF